MLVHAVRESIKGEGPTWMLRTLDGVLARLQKEGGPKHHSLIGGGGASEALVCVAAPWQESEVTTRTVEKETSFIFTRKMLEEALHEEGGRNLLIASLMNGYGVQDPVGKRVKRADTVVLRSRIAPELYDVIRKAVRTYAGGKVRIVSFGEVAQGVLHAAYPEEHDYVALRVAQEATEAAFVRRGLLSSVRSAPCGTGVFLAAARGGGVSSLEAVAKEDGVIDRTKSTRLAGRLDAAQAAWVQEMRECLSSLAAGGPLPRSVYLFAEAGTAGFLKRLFDAPELHALWLSDEPLSVIEVQGEVFDAYLHRTEGSADDAFLDALALLSPR